MAAAKKTAKKTPAREATKKKPAREAAKKKPAREAAKKTPAREATKKKPAREATKKKPAREATKKKPAREAAKKTPARKAAKKAPARKPRAGEGGPRPGGRGGLAFGPEFFASVLPSMVAACPCPEDRENICYVYLADGGRLDVTEVLAVADQFVLLGVFEGAGEDGVPRTEDDVGIEAVPYELILRVAVRRTTRRVRLGFHFPLEELAAATAAADVATRVNGAGTTRKAGKTARRPARRRPAAEGGVEGGAEGGVEGGAEGGEEVEAGGAAAPSFSPGR